MSFLFRPFRSKHNQVQTPKKQPVPEDAEDKVEMSSWTLLEKASVDALLSSNSFKERDVMTAIGYLKKRGTPVTITSLIDKIYEINVQVKEDDCIICFDKKIECALVPCGHFGFCQTCVSGIKNLCPICRTKVDLTVKIYPINLC